jgi:alkanesulfonate monooxygenase SsuD/methylene tetrahydromethanopterin reductase-like flavin-dependent oxidoreductase (luciferase family)
MRHPRYGLSLPNRGVLFGATSVDELLALSEQVDASGAIDSIWVGDSLFAKPRLESLVLLSSIAARTRRVRLGTCCLSTFPLRDPLFLAAQWAALDHVSAGRMILGACVGGSQPREKAEADRALRRVGLIAEGWMTDNTPVARFRERWELIRRVAREANRRTETMEAALHLMVNINEDRHAAFEEAVKFLHSYYSPAMTREYIEGWLAYGPPAAVLEKIRAYVDAGCTTPILRFASWDQKGQLARALADVLPAARALPLPA